MRARDYPNGTTQQNEESGDRVDKEAGNKETKGRKQKHSPEQRCPQKVDMGEAVPENSGDLQGSLATLSDEFPKKQVFIRLLMS